MCGRYTLHKEGSEIVKRYNLASAPREDIRPNYNAAPTQKMPVVTQDEDGPKLEIMQWGLLPFWAKDKPGMAYKTFNARDDNIFEKPMWRKIILKKRALIPADGFYEWNKISPDKNKPKQPYLFKPKHEELFSFAGVWDSFKDDDGNEVKTYSIITTEPNKEMSKYHNRMPVILHREDESSWLEPSHSDRGDIEPLLRPYEDNGLEINEVSIDVNNARNNYEELVAPLNSQ